MIYSHISVEKQRDAVNSLDDTRSRVVKFLQPKNKRVDIRVKHQDKLIGRDQILEEINKFIKDGISIILTGQKGCGKSAILKEIKDVIYISEYKKKQTLIKIILTAQNITEPSVCKEATKELKKLPVDELIMEIRDLKKVVIIDDISELTKLDRKVVSKLSQNTVVLTSSSRLADKKLFKTYVEIKPLKRYHTRIILSDMIQMNNPRKKERIIDDILHQAGDNLKDAEYIASQLQLGKSSEEITTKERESNQQSIAPFLLIVMFFFVAFVLKSYTTSMVAMSYAMLVVFRLLFNKYMFMPATKK